MTFARVNPGGWALYEVLTSAQMNQLDINVTRAVDGYAGGIYNPSGKLVWNHQVEIDVSGLATPANIKGLDVVAKGTANAIDGSSPGGAGIAGTGGAFGGYFIGFNSATVPGRGVQGEGGDFTGASGDGAPGGYFKGGDPAGSGKQGASVHCEHHVKFAGTDAYQNPAITTSLFNELRGTNVVKAWCVAELGTSPTFLDGAGFSSISSGGSNEIDFVLADNMRDTNYAVVVTQNSQAGASIATFSAEPTAANAFELYGRTYPGSLANLNAATYDDLEVSIIVMGEQVVP